MPIHHGDLFDVLPTLEAESIDACVTDPPYDLTANKRGGTGEASLNLNSPAGRSRISTGGGFMGKEWDGQGVAFNVETWRLVYRVLKPGAHLLACGGTRTYHRMASAIEAAGFEIRDSLIWIYGSGFPKSLNLGEGLGTALKPAHEPIVMARKPFTGSVRSNVEKHGTGALNIDACRIATTDETARACHAAGYGLMHGDSPRGTENATHGGHESGRWPANVCLDEYAAMVLDEMSGESESSGFRRGGDLRFNGKTYAQDDHTPGMTQTDKYSPADIGGASRFFYIAKPSRDERDMGCYDLPVKNPMELTGRKADSAGLKHGRSGTDRAARNFHPTVKPVELMRWLVRLVTPVGGTVLDPFMGSGTTGMACVYEQREFIGIEREAEYVAIAERRIADVAPLFTVDAGHPERAQVAEPRTGELFPIEPC